MWIIPVIENDMPGSTYTRQESPAASSRSKIVSASFWRGKLS